MQPLDLWWTLNVHMNEPRPASHFLSHYLCDPSVLYQTIELKVKTGSALLRQGRDSEGGPFGSPVNEESPFSVFLRAMEER